MKRAWYVECVPQPGFETLYLMVREDDDCTMIFVRKVNRPRLKVEVWDWNERKAGAEVNWAAYGPVDPSDAAAYSILIREAALLAEALNDDKLAETLQKFWTEVTTDELRAILEDETDL